MDVDVVEVLQGQKNQSKSSTNGQAVRNYLVVLVVDLRKNGINFEIAEKNVDSYVDVVAVVVVSVVAEVDVLPTIGTGFQGDDDGTWVTYELVDVVVGSPGQ